MLLHLRRLSSQTIIFGIGDAMTRVVALVLLPIYTHILTTEEYGKLAIITLVSTIALLILDSGLGTAFFRFYFQMKSPPERRKLTGTILIYLLLAGVVILLPLILLFDWIAPLFITDASLGALIRIALIGTLFDLSSVIPFAIFRAENRAKRYATLSFVRFFVGATLNIIAVVTLRKGALGVVYANLLTSILIFIICLVQTLRAIEWTMDTKLLRRLLVFGLPLIPAHLAAWALNLSDRIFLQKYAGFSELGVYAVSYSIAGLLNMVIGWFNTAYAPYCYSIADQADARIVYARIFTYALALFSFFGLCLSVFAREALMLLTTPAYYGAAKIVPLIVLSYLFLEINYLLSFGLDLTGKTGYGPFIIGTGAIINLILNYTLIPLYGMIGAALATVISYMMLPVIQYPIVRRLYFVGYEWKRLSKLAFISVSIYLISFVLKTNLILVNLGVGSLLIILWLLTLYWWKFFTLNELSAVRSMSSQLLGTFKSYFRPSSS